MKSKKKPGIINYTNAVLRKQNVLKAILAKVKELSDQGKPAEALNMLLRYHRVNDEV